MNDRGERSGPLVCYGEEFDRPDQLLKKVFHAWDVKEAYLVNPCQSYDGPRTPKITRESGPAYMLRFADGKWRFASFQGINGPPWTRCEDKAYEAETGREAWLKWQERLALKDVQIAEAELQRALAKHARITEELADIFTKRVAKAK